MQIDKKHKKAINTILQVLILIFIIIFFLQKLKNDELTLSIEQFIISFEDHYPFWIFILLLMPLNWALEAIKWKELSRPLLFISFLSALKGVITGLSISFITPHGWGDYLGRIAIINREKREKLIGALFFGKMAQLFITVIAGVTGLVMYFEVRPYLYFWYIFILFIIALLMTFNRTFYRLLKPHLRKIKRFFSIIKSYNAKTVLFILIISAVRYMVFTMQFLLIMIILNVDLDIFLIFSGITWIFLIKSIVPSFNFLSDLGIREVSAVMFFEPHLNDVSPVISATFIIWVINIFVPSVIGTFFVFSVKALR
jgi:hypothetical protein